MSQIRGAVARARKGFFLCVKQLVDFIDQRPDFHRDVFRQA